MVIIQLIDDEGVGTLVTVIEPKEAKKPEAIHAPVLRIPVAEPQVVPVTPQIRRS